ncbi:C4-dicarboxylate ABC transporter, partial [Pseudomonas sp. PCH446]
EVAAASGGLLAPHLLDTHMQFNVLITSYVLWAFSVPVAFSILVILLLRMACTSCPMKTWRPRVGWRWPDRDWSPGHAVAGADSPAIFATNGFAGIGDIASGMGLIAGIILWGLGLWWMLMAVLITLRYLRRGIPFNLGWWGFTFPLGVYALATLKLGSTLHLVFSAALVWCWWCCWRCSG